MATELPIGTALAALVGAALVIGFAGTRLTGLADRVADRTGLGEAVIGAALLGMATSLSGLVVSFSAALDGLASLAFSNAVGGIAVQTAFLALADLALRRTNLEHSAAELANMFQAALLSLMLTMPILAYSAPEISLFAVHPVSLALVALYAVGVAATSHVRERPMWEPVNTADTLPDVVRDEREGGPSNAALALGFLGLAALLASAGFVLSESAAVVSEAFGISQTAIGALLTALVTSLPELVTTLAAVRSGALALAVGGIIGGNAFDTVFLSVADAGFREGSLYHAISAADLFWLTVGLAMNALLLIGLLVRQRQGPGNIGLESAGILALYAGAVALQVYAG